MLFVNPSNFCTNKAQESANLLHVPLPCVSDVLTVLPARARQVRVEDPDDAETALLLDAPLEEQHSPRPAARRRPPGHSPPPPDMIDVCLDPSCDSDDELLVV